jgi:hypothetical protein
MINQTRTGEEIIEVLAHAEQGSNASHPSSRAS